MYIPKKYLLLIAGIVWSFAGCMVMKIGFPLVPSSSYRVATILGAFLIFYVFYHFIFSSLVYKHEKRIRNTATEKMPFWLFFDLRSYIIMIVMMGGGMSLRSFNLLPEGFIAFFYSGLGFALFACGVRFIFRYFRYDKGLRYIPRLEKKSADRPK